MDMRRIPRLCMCLCRWSEFVCARGRSGPRPGWQHHITWAVRGRSQYTHTHARTQPHTYLEPLLLCRHTLEFVVILVAELVAREQKRHVSVLDRLVQCREAGEGALDRKPRTLARVWVIADLPALLFALRVCVCMCVCVCVCVGGGGGGGFFFWGGIITPAGKADRVE